MLLIYVTVLNDPLINSLVGRQGYQGQDYENSGDFWRLCRTMLQCSVVLSGSYGCWRSEHLDMGRMAGSKNW